jgi:hypothetical protein
MNKYLCTCLALFLSASSLASAQRDMQQALPDTRTAAVSSAARDRAEGLIQLDVLVTDATGNPVSGLGEADFSLLENGRPQNILSFQAFDGREASSEPPVKIILLIDTIELPEIMAREERLAVMTYLRRGVGRLERPVTVFLLAESGLWTVARSGDGNVLAREIEHSQQISVLLIERTRAASDGLKEEGFCAGHENTSVCARICCSGRGLRLEA